MPTLAHTKMARVLTALALLALTNSAVACGNDHAHAHDPPTRRGYPPVPVAPPARPLQWGDINVIHTTDSHGWLLGHTKSSFPEPNYSGDLGDFASFVKHMKDMAQVRAYSGGGEKGAESAAASRRRPPPHRLR
jgi:2',3'-cyclic-nucleotide 2'-phosphodiesterase (5'-nucleotidase family)